MSSCRLVFRHFLDYSNRIKLTNCNYGRYLVSQTRLISGKLRRDPDYQRPKPWPYETKKFTFLHGYIDNTMDRFDENTKVIVVDGNIASGKSVFAEALAKELDMKYFPEVTMDNIYINDYGFDLRKLDPLLPESCKSVGIEKFYANPKNPLFTTQFQIWMLYLRLEQYLDALAHLLNTGQGVVLDRSIYSDFVFLETMYKFGYISREAKGMYYEGRENVIYELLRPHLVIYLDVPVPLILERIKKRNIPFEVNSKVLTPEYLSTLEYNYKQKFLKSLSAHSELLIYDWSNYGDVEVVVEDIERIDFDSVKPRDDDKKLKDWKITDKWKWHLLRRRYTNTKDRILKLAFVARFDVPEMLRPAEDAMIYTEVMQNAPGERFNLGYNTDQGDTGILFKSSQNYRQAQKLKIYNYSMF